MALFHGRLKGNGGNDGALIFKLGPLYNILLKDDNISIDPTTDAESLANRMGIIDNTKYNVVLLENKKINVSFELVNNNIKKAQMYSESLIVISEQLITLGNAITTVITNTLSADKLIFTYQINIASFVSDYGYDNKLNLFIGKVNNIIATVLSENNINTSVVETPTSITNILNGSDAKYTTKYTVQSEQVAQQLVPNSDEDQIIDESIDSTTVENPNNSMGDEQEIGRAESTGEDDIQGSDSGGERVPGITNIFPNTYYPEKIEMGVTAPEQSKGEIAQGIGTLPFIWYNVYQISYADITYFLLSDNGICPTMKIVFYDSLGIMSDNGIPIDDSKIKVYIDSGASNLKPIFLEFKISNFSVVDGLYNILGVLDLSKLYLPDFKAYKDKSSFEALQEIAKELGLGFNSNLANTDDAMTWVNTGDKVYDFIDSIVSTSYKSDYSFMLGYIDYYYNYNYVDIEDELSRDISNEQAVTSFGLEQAANAPTEDQIGSLTLSNDTSFEGTNMFIEKYKIINNSTNVSLLEGYLTKTKYYDESSKELLVFDIDSISSEGGKIVMKSGDQDFYNKNINLVYNGKIDVDNAHKNYNYSNIQNDRNVTELSKLALDTVLANPNYNLYKFQKVKVIISSETATPSHTLVNERLTGDWFIIDIKFELIGARFYQKVLLIKRELEALAGEEYRSENSVYGETNENGEGSNPDNLDNTDVANVAANARSPLTNNSKLSDRLKPIIAAFAYWKITNKYYKKAILGNIKKECNLVPQYEDLSGWANSSNARIRQYFSRRVRNYSEAQLTVLKKDSPRFAEAIYGVNSGMGLGNDKPGDAWKYRGAGYIQLTGKSNFRTWGKYANVDLVANPGILISDPYKSAIVAVGFIVKQIKNGNFTNQNSANRAVTQIIGGGKLNLDAGVGAEILARVNDYSDDFNNVV